MAYNVATNETSVIIGIEAEGIPEAFSFKLSADRKYILISRSIQRVRYNIYLSYLIL